MAEGFKDFTAGDVLTAAQVDDYLMSQAVMRFADAAARNSALTEVEGMIAFLKDVNTLTAYDGTSWWTVGRANSSVTSYSPTLTQLGTVAINVVVGEYSICNGWCDFTFGLTCNGAGGTGNNVVTVSLPVTAAAASDRTVGSGHIYEDSGNVLWHGSWRLNATTTVALLAGGSANTDYWGVTPVTGLTSGCTVGGHVRYRVASAA